MTTYRARSRSNLPGNLGCGALAVLAGIVVVVLGLIFWHMEYGTQHDVTFTIKSLDDQASGSKGHKYLIFTTDGHVYENTDAWFHGKTDSSNLWAGFSVGQTWTCPVYGYRNTLFSSYPDILDGCKQVTR